jgi:methionine sulfoxide reductase catalytic subunit
MQAMRARPTNDPLASEITPRDAYLTRREFMKKAALLSIAGIAAPVSASAAAQVAITRPLQRMPSPYSTREKLTPYKDVTGYVNYYEFGTGKRDPPRYAPKMRTRPWAVVVDGEVHRPRTFDIDALLKLTAMEERIYRLRCVEGWSMVIPWIGYPLAALAKAVRPTGNAKYVAFTSHLDRSTMIGVRAPLLDWPYAEGLRMDEALHPLTLLTFGLYGEILPNQNGAPLRVVVPWKYGYKSAKAIVRITFTEHMPKTAWSTADPEVYGFYSNVNPTISNGRQNQSTERRIGEDGFFARKRKTLMFNGYVDQVGQLYTGMDLQRYY